MTSVVAYYIALQAVIDILFLIGLGCLYNRVWRLEVMERRNTKK